MKTRYQILGRICTTTGSHFHHVRTLSEDVPAVLKIPNTEHDPHTQSERFHQEYAVLQSLNVAGIVKPEALIMEQGQPAMLLSRLEANPNGTGTTHHCLERTASCRPRQQWPVDYRPGTAS